MKNSIVVLIISVLTSLSVSAQLKTKKYLRDNRNVEPVSYTDSSTYSRGIVRSGNKLIIGNANGSIFYWKDGESKPQLLFKQANFVEVRDLEETGRYIVGIQSAEDGKLVIIDKSGSIKIIQPEFFQGVFIDGIDFIGANGFMMGDPKNGNFSLFHSSDHGFTWTECEGKVASFPEEAGFAASGTNVQMLNDSTYIFVSGGMRSRYFRSNDRGKTWTSVDLPYYPGKSTGPYSICFSNDSTAVMVGGDYKDPDIKLNTCFYSHDGGESWLNAENPPRGYRSCVFEKNGIFYCCGENGIDVSFNRGIDWAMYSEGTFFALTANDSQLIATSKFGTLFYFDLLSADDE